MSYTLTKLLGRGAFGSVYLGYNKENGEMVTVKVIPNKAELANRIQREISLPRLLSGHKNIASLLDVQADTNYVYLISEYINHGVPLDRWKIPDDIISLLDMMIELTDAYLYIHSFGIAHRDIKLENVVMKGNIPIIIDWDLACLNLVNSSFPCSGFVGTREYIAPEIWQKEENYNPFLADVYALGVVFYYLLNGRRFPYSGDTNQEIRSNVLRGKLEPSLSGYPDLDTMVMLMLEPNPETRISLEEVRDVLILIMKEI